VSDRQYYNHDLVLQQADTIAALTAERDALREAADRAMDAASARGEESARLTVENQRLRERVERLEDAMQRAIASADAVFPSMFYGEPKYQISKDAFRGMMKAMKQEATDGQ